MRSEREKTLASAYLLEETKRSGLGGVDGSFDLLRRHGSITGLSLDSDLTELSDELGGLLLLRIVELILELIHRLLGIGADGVTLVGFLDDVLASLVGLGVQLSIGTMHSISCR